MLILSRLMRLDNSQTDRGSVPRPFLRTREKFEIRGWRKGSGKSSRGNQRRCDRVNDYVTLT